MVIIPLLTFCVRMKPSHSQTRLPDGTLPVTQVQQKPSMCLATTFQQKESSKLRITYEKLASERMLHSICEDVRPITTNPSGLHLIIRSFPKLRQSSSAYYRIS